MGLREDSTGREGLIQPRLRSPQLGEHRPSGSGKDPPRAEPGQMLLITPGVISWTQGVVASVLTSQQILS